MFHKSLPPVTPGEVLQEEFLKPLKLSQYELAKRISVPPRRINEIVKGMRAVTADTAIRLARYFDMSERFWLNLQMQHDVEKKRRELGVRLEDEVRRGPSYHPPRMGVVGTKIFLQMEDGKTVRVTPRTMRKHGAALMEPMRRYFEAQGKTLSEVRLKAYLEAVRRRAWGLYVIMENEKLVRVTPRAIRKYGDALMEPINRLFEAQGTTFLEFLEKVRVSKGPRGRRTDG